MALPDRLDLPELSRRSRQVSAALAARIQPLVGAARSRLGADGSWQHEMEGSITAVGFSSGNRIVVGNWHRSPIGPFADVMWAEPDDWRTLFVPTEAARSFVTAVYGFDSVHLAPDLSVVEGGGRIRVSWSEAVIDLTVGRPVPFPPRNDWIADRVERPVARLTMGVNTRGVSPTGVEESYRARRLRRVTAGRGTVAGQDLGTVGAPRPACRFGFSEPPPFASVTELTTYLADPSGRLDEVLATVDDGQGGVPPAGGAG